MSTKFDSTYSAVVSMAEQLVGEGKYDSTYSAVLAIYQNLTSDVDTKFDSVYSIVVTIADGIESGEIDLGGGGDDSGEIDPQKYNTHKFYDYAGRLVEEWTLEETQSKTELPTLGGIPFGSWTLNFDGWNWDLEQLKSASCGQNIGAMYRPSDGKTRISVDIEPENLTYVLFVSGDYTIDWGDGTIETEWDTIYPTHTYESEGLKTITLTGTDIRPLFGTPGNYNGTYEEYKGWYYNSRIKTFISGTKMNSLNFGYCTNLEFLTFTGDTHVYSSSFYYFAETKSLKYLAIPKGITSYPRTSKSIEVISMPYGVTNINNSIFSSCHSLQSINIPNSVTSIYNYVFQECTSLKFINIPNSVTSIASQSFYDCYSLQSINIPNSVTSIGSNAFYDCYALQSVTIPNSVTSIGSNAFQNCHSLQTITIPNSVTSISNYMLVGCTSLQSITIPNSVTSIGDSVFMDCDSLQSVILPNSVTSIASQSFYGCTSLASIEIPNSVTSIGSWMFWRCQSLKSITIPNSVTSIGDSVFYDCMYITVDFSNCTQVPTLSSTNSFNSTALILVPESLYDEWIASTNWSSLTSQIKPIPGK